MYSAAINTSYLTFKGFDITIEVYPSLICVSVRLPNGDLFKRKYIGYSKRGALENFKEELKCL